MMRGEWRGLKSKQSIFRLKILDFATQRQIKPEVYNPKSAIWFLHSDFSIVKGLYRQCLPMAAQQKFERFDGIHWR